MNRSVCIRCGYYKAQPLAKCARCGFQPVSESDQAKSLVLSPAFDVGGTTIGRSAEELSDIAAQIEAGTPYAFAHLELEVVSRQHRLAKSTSPHRLLWIAAKWVAPAIVLLAVILWLGMRS